MTHFVEGNDELESGGVPESADSMTMDAWHSDEVDTEVVNDAVNGKEVVSDNHEGASSTIVSLPPVSPQLYLSSERVAHENDFLTVAGR